MLSPKILKAFKVANSAHDGQFRKGTNIPYIVHPLNVMTTALKYTNDEDILAACLLHDVLEDAYEKYSEEDMRRDFGDKITEIVMNVSEPKDITEWKARKLKYLTQLKNAHTSSVVVSVSDKIQNIEDTLRDYLIIGDKVWEKFHTSKNEQIWFYQSVYDIARGRDDLPRDLVDYFDIILSKLAS